jgi:hypothetical protein
VKKKRQAIPWELSPAKNNRRIGTVENYLYVKENCNTYII